MSTAELQQPILEGGIRSINFFNGRLLTARDLTREQVANRDVDKRLGQAVGDGIAYGFEVSESKSTSPQSTSASPILTIAAGLAINRRGQTLKLDKNVEVGLVRQPGNGAGSGRPFNECMPLQTGTYTAGAGVYLLTVAPAETTEGLAATAGLERAIASCNTDTIVSALQFRLVPLNPPLTDAELDDENYLRNLIAYKCFGVDELRSVASDPFGTTLDKYGLLDSLRPNRLTECDVPLAVLYWTLLGGIRFIDLWSVRRQSAVVTTGRTEATEALVAVARHWEPALGDRRRREGQAMFLQFQEQVLDLVKPEANPETLIAKEHFRFLPPAGALPTGASSPPGTPSLRAFNYLNFFRGVTYREPVYLEGARVEKLLRDSWAYKPVDLSSGEMFWLYWVRENGQAAVSSAAPVRTYLIFASGQMPFVAQPKFDVARWNYSNFM